MQKMILNDNKGSHVVKVSDIIYCMAQGCYTVFYFSDGSNKTFSRTLKYYVQDLTVHFFVRAHRKYLLNPAHIKKLAGKNVLLSTGTIIPVSVRCKRSLIAGFNNYLKAIA